MNDRSRGLAGLRRAACSGALVLAAALLAGCGEKPTVAINHGSPQLLAMSVQEAIDACDYPAVVQAMHSDFRRPFRSMLWAMREYISELQALSELVGERIGPQQAARFEALAARIYTGVLPRPLDNAIEEGKVDWDKVTVLDEGYCHALMIRGHNSRFDGGFVLIEDDGQWFIMPRLKGEEPKYLTDRYRDEAGAAADAFKSYTKVARDIQRKVQSGAYNRENFDHMMTAVSAGGEK